MNKLSITPKLTPEMIMAAIEEDSNSGFCINCGAETDGVEPDAEEYMCDACGGPFVYGAEQLLIYMA